MQFLPFSLEMEQRICDRLSTSWREQRPDRGCYRWRRTTHVTREGEGGREGGKGNGGRGRREGSGTVGEGGGGRGKGEGGRERGGRERKGVRGGRYM